MKECKVGTLSWFAGVFWLLLSCASHAASHVAFWFHLNWVAWQLIRLTCRCNAAAVACAIEGGAEL